METNRQKKIAGVIQKDLGNIISTLLKGAGHHNIIISVTKVRVTPDLLQAKAYLSVFPEKHGEELVKSINEIKNKIKHQLAQLTKNQLRRVPELQFFNDDTQAYLNEIEDAFKGKNNPLKDS
ncbi:ribosome-binding factor A [Psychroflexus maritimus]|uniref:Ribosome-binding factor A n=1 Tax=Psychroflexus maritimus TaxID=2714865 RepID=A0A967ACY8_9FLAO|nr:ribosome-binding factor A [Psychroflexus maritimus]NGZ89816.1 ribosome-binding factor A [Psychroflexus maritimus]